MVSTILLFVVLLVLSCRQPRQKEQEQTANELQFTLMDPALTGLQFTNTLIESDSVNPVDYQYVYNGSGVAIGDINNDGLQDVFFGSNMGPCKLFLNKGNLRFDDITLRAGVATNRWVTGVTMADVNADGFLDIYVCCSGKLSGPDYRANRLFINNQNLTFSEKAAAYGLDDMGYSSQATFFDYDKDNDLDLFVLNQPLEINFTILDKEIINNKINAYTSSRFYRNEGDGRFTDVSKAAGVQSNAFSLSCTVGDLNTDGWPDMYVCNDYTMSDFLYMNNQNGTFTDQHLGMLKHTSNFAMGCDVADFNNDGLMDIIQADMLPESNYRQKLMLGPNNYDRYYFLMKKGYGSQFMQNCLQLNNGNGTFSEIAAFAGLEKTDWSWATLFADFDNDGWKDVFIDNGYLRDFTNMDQILYRSEILRKNNGRIPVPMEVVRSIPSTPLTSYIFQNNRDLTFSNRTQEWGIREKMFANGAAYGDLDNDGDLDLVINNLNMPAVFYRNNANERDSSHFITFQMKGNNNNTSGIGSHIILYSGNLKQISYVMPVRGFCSAVDSRVHFGLGSATGADSAYITWSDGKVNQLYRLPADSIILVDYRFAVNGKGFPEILSPKKNTVTLFEELRSHAPSFRHTENEFIDFKREPLLATMHSRPGPGLASGDVNSDGLDDVFIGGAKGQAAGLFLQSEKGDFKRSVQDALERDKGQEDAGALFFDADQDGDLDLYVVSGGSEVAGYHPYYQDRLYFNQGSGRLMKNSNALPEINSSGSCVSAFDFDGDGDLDLFRGGRISAGNYPYHPRSYLLENNKGVFLDVTEKLAPALAYTGMVTAAVWADYDGDRQNDLVLTGEWMPLRLFKNNKGHFIETTSSAGLDYTGGWWNCIAAADFDKDGDPDFAAGNLGTNTRIRTAPGNPASVYARDFDANGSTDALICHVFSDGKVYPMNSRDELTDQLRGLRKVIHTYEDYATKTIEQLIPEAELKKALIQKSYTFHTSWFENNGKGSFILHALPGLAQVSQVNAMVTGDFNADGNTDILLAGNNYSLNPVQGRLDAGTGLLLAGDGKGRFRQHLSAETGFLADRDVKHLVKLKDSRGRGLILVGNNDDAVQLFLMRH